MYSITESCPSASETFPKLTLSFPLLLALPQLLSTWPKSYAFYKSLPTVFPFYTAASFSFLESKSVIVTPLLKHLFWLPIAWGLSPVTSGLSSLSGLVPWANYNRNWHQDGATLCFNRTLYFSTSCSKQCHKLWMTIVQDIRRQMTLFVVWKT